MASRVAAAERDRIFFTGAALAVAATVFAGFARTYYLSHWLTQPARAPAMSPLLQIHAAIFTIWIALGAIQPALVAAGRRRLHVSLGIFGAVGAALVWLFGNLVAAEAIGHGFRGVGDPFAFYAITFFSIQAFGILALLGILNRHRPEAHKRLMLLSSAAILEAAFGRLPLHSVAAAAPFSFYLGSDLVVLAGIIHDRLSRGRIHPVWIWGGGGLVVSQFVRVAVMQGAPWLAFAHAVAAFWR